MTPPPPRVTTGAAPCTLAQSDVEASRCGCFAHAMHSVQGAARCANHRDAPWVQVHTGGDAPRCTVHLGAWRCKKGKNAVSISVLDLASFLSAVAVLPKG